MGGACGQQFRVLSQTPGRVRIHVSVWSNEPVESIEGRLLRVFGVEVVKANPLTSNVLVRFDPMLVGTEEIVAALRQQPGPGFERAKTEPGREVSVPPLLRAGARGLLGHAAVDALWFGAGFLGKRLGLPLSALGPLHVLLDLVVWSAAFASTRGASVASANPFR
jgi:hypothetical protein